MAGLGVRLYTDEMIHKDLAPTLRQRGYDVESTLEAGRSNQKIPDEDQLLYAAQRGRAILTWNMDEFVALDKQWKAAGRPHAGIIISPQRQGFGQLLQLTQEHLDYCDPAIQHDTLLWLGSIRAP